MPATAPLSLPVTGQQLRLLGERIQAQRLSLRISANATAQAAGMSRVTLHRIERGEPSVTMGAYLNALTALGLGLQVAPQAAVVPPPTPGPIPANATVRIADHPPLRALAWQLPDTAEITEPEALALLERNWRHLDFDNMAEPQRQWIRSLVSQHGGGYLLV